MVCSALALYFIGISQSWLAVLLLIVQMLILSDPEAVSAELLNTTYRWSIDLFIEIWSPLMSLRVGTRMIMDEFHKNLQLNPTFDGIKMGQK